MLNFNIYCLLLTYKMLGDLLNVLVAHKFIPIWKQEGYRGSGEQSLKIDFFQAYCSLILLAKVSAMMPEMN